MSHSQNLTLYIWQSPNKSRILILHTFCWPNPISWITSHLHCCPTSWNGLTRCNLRGWYLKRRCLLILGISTSLIFRQFSWVMPGRCRTYAILLKDQPYGEDSNEDFVGVIFRCTHLLHVLCYHTTKNPQIHGGFISSFNPNTGRPR